MKFERLDCTFKLPTMATTGAAGFDLYCPKLVEWEPGTICTVSLGIKCQIEPGWAGFIKDRSSLAKRGLHVLGGVIDSDYTDEWWVIMANLGLDLQYLEKNERIAQVIFVPFWTGAPVKTKRTGGLGSTGR